MAQTIRTHVSDGVTVLYAVDFDLGYIRKEFVYVYQGESTDYETQLSYTWVNTSQIQLDAPVAIGEEFYIRRVVPRNAPVNDYVDGAILKEKNLDDSYAQALMIQEEVADGFVFQEGEDYVLNVDLDMNGNRIRNAAPATEADELVTLGQVNQLNALTADLAVIARSLNVLDSQVIYSTDTVTVLDNVLYIYDASAQVTWGVPTLNGVGETITSVTGSDLVTSWGSYKLLTIISLLGGQFSFESVADMKAGILSNGKGNINWATIEIGTEIPWLGYYSVFDGGDNNGVLLSGAHTDDGGSIFSIDANRYIKANLENKQVNVQMFGTKAGVNSSGSIRSACDYLASANSFEKSKSLLFPGRHSYLIETQINLDVSHGNMKWWSDGNASLDIRNLASEHPLVVDFSTGGTANFLKFDMENIHFTDTSLSYLRRGPLLHRVIGSRFVNCHFNYLAIALGIDDDSNLNHFDSCQWRGNDRCIVGYTGGSNNNVFTNCQFRYNTGTVLNCIGDNDFPGTFAENLFLGGDFEPYNTGDPIIYADHLQMINTRFERNTQLINNIVALNNCKFDNISFHSDGATQAYGVSVVGRDNQVHINAFSGVKAIDFSETSANNSYSIGGVISLLTTNDYSLVTDNGKNNVAVINSTPQTKLVSTLDTYAVDPDLTTWTAFGCAVTPVTDGYNIVADGTQSEAYIYVLFSGTGNYEGINVGVSANPQNQSGQLTVQISSTLTINSGTNFKNVGKWKRGYVSAFNYQTAITYNPYIIIKLLGAGSGAACTVRDFSISFTKSMPTL